MLNTLTVSMKTPMSLCSTDGLSLNLLLMRLGDMAWDLTSTMSRTDVYNAKRAGAACYLGFTHVRFSTNQLHLGDIAPGDPITISLSVYRTEKKTSQRLYALARVTRGLANDPGNVKPRHFFRPEAGSIGVSLGMSWISRDRRGSNKRLSRAVPDGFCTESMPSIDAESVARFRDDYQAARERAETNDVADQQEAYYIVSEGRDLNGVQLLYFANYAAIYDEALRPLARRQGFSPAQFKTLDLYYYGNADVNECLRVHGCVSGNRRETRVRLERTLTNEPIGTMEVTPC